MNPIIKIKSRRSLYEVFELIDMAYKTERYTGNVGEDEMINFLATICLRRRKRKRRRRWGWRSLSSRSGWS